MNSKLSTSTRTVATLDPPYEADSVKEEQREVVAESGQAPESGDSVLNRLADRMAPATRRSSRTADTRVKKPKPRKERIYTPPTRGFD